MSDASAERNLISSRFEARDVAPRMRISLFLSYSPTGEKKKTYFDLKASLKPTTSVGPTLSLCMCTNRLCVPACFFPPFAFPRDMSKPNNANTFFGSERERGLFPVKFLYKVPHLGVPTYRVIQTFRSLGMNSN